MKEKLKKPKKNLNEATVTFQDAILSAHLICSIKANSFADFANFKKHSVIKFGNIDEGKIKETKEEP